MHEKLTIIPASDIDQWVAQIRSAQGNTLVVGHSDTLPKIIQELTGSPVSLGGGQYDLLFVIAFQPNAGAPVELHYCKPSGPEPERRMPR